MQIQLQQMPGQWQMPQFTGECFKKEKGREKTVNDAEENDWEQGQQERGVSAVITMTAENKL